MTKNKFVPYWRTGLGRPEIKKVSEAILNGRVSQGAVTQEFEERLAQTLGVPYVVATTSASAALFMALSVLGIQRGDEVIVPNRTFIATAHAVLMTGAKVRLVDTRPDSTLVDEARIEENITRRTKAIIAVHLNGDSVDMRAVKSLARRYRLKVIEDAAQAFYSKNKFGFLGTQSDIGCFSLGVVKFITTGQGGFLAVRSRDLYDKLVKFRSHGVVSTFAAPAYDRFGFNLKFNDILASVGLAQMDRMEEKKRAHRHVYDFYRKELVGIDFIRLTPFDQSQGQIPLYVEALCAAREKTMALLERHGVQTRPFLPNLHVSPHLGNQRRAFPNSMRFAEQGLFLPCGPTLPQSALDRTIEVLRALRPKIPERF